MYNWSTTPAANDTAATDDGINWPEGMSPAEVNNSARAMMAEQRKVFNDQSGALETTGVAPAYVLTTNYAFGGSLVDGARVMFRIHSAVTGTSTLNVDSSGAKPLRKAPSVELAPGDLAIGVPYGATYDAGDDEWIIDGAPGPSGLFNLRHGADIASAATVNLATATGNFVDITGSVGISAIDMNDGQQMLARFTGAPTLTNGANLACPAGRDLSVAAGTILHLVRDGSVTRVSLFAPAQVTSDEKSAGTETAERGFSPADVVAMISSFNKVRQLVSVTKDSSFSTSSTSFTDVTGWTLSITPTANNSKILVFGFGYVGHDNANGCTWLQLTRDSTAIAIGEAASNRIRATAGGRVDSNASVTAAPIVAVDEPNTTSATTYKVQARVDTGSGHVGRMGQDTDNSSHGRYPSVLVAVEVAA